MFARFCRRTGRNSAVKLFNRIQDLSAAESLKDVVAGGVSPPGATITALLEERGWTQRDLVKRVCSSEKQKCDYSMVESR